MNIKTELEKELGADSELRFNNIDIDPPGIKAIMINEVVPTDHSQDFLWASRRGLHENAILLFQKAGIDVSSIQEILQLGIYITNAVKMPKTEYAIEKSSIEKSLPYLEKKCRCSQHQVIMLMGDVAKRRLT